MSAHLPSNLSEPLLSRVCGEFLEMPGLRLTRKQAQRLWGLDEDTCTRLLDFLVEIKFLRRSGADSYARLTEGAEPNPALRMARAELRGKRRTSNHMNASRRSSS